MPKKRVTVQEIADCCGLSKSTVAYVLREPTTCRATEETRRKVLDMARTMGYQGNPAARALSTRRYRTIGMLLPMTEGYYGELMMSLDRVMKQRGYHGIYSFWENGSFTEALSNLCRQGIDGLISLEYSKALAETGKPVVMFGNLWPEWDCVYPDKADYMRQTVAYLRGRGYRKIGFMGLTHELRAVVLREELSRYNLPVREEWFIDTFATRANGAMAAEKLLSLSERPEAVILHSDILMSGLVHAAAGRIDIPRELAVISFDNLRESAYFQPPLTTFDQCLDQVAEWLVDTLLKRIADPKLPRILHSYTIPMIERNSVPNINGRNNIV